LMIMQFANTQASSVSKNSGDSKAMADVGV